MRHCQARCAGTAACTGWMRLPYDSSASILIARLPSMSTTEKRVNGLVCCGSPTTCQGAVGALPTAPNGASEASAASALLAARAKKAHAGTKGRRSTGAERERW